MTAITEPILSDNGCRKYTAFPIQYPDLWNMYKKAVASFWTVEEVPLGQDVIDWRDKLNDDERYFIKHILGFFASSDGIVMENLQMNFSHEVTVPEARQFYAYQAFNESIHCVVPETKILTDTGYHKIGTLVGEHVNVWNGEEFSEVDIVKTGVDVPIIKVQLTNGMSLECTTGHKWFVRKGPKGHPELSYVERVMTKDLCPGDIIAKYDVPVVNTNDPDVFLNPYTHGFFCGDGTYVHNKYPVISLCGEKKNLLQYLEVSSNGSVSVDDKHDKMYFYITDKINKQKFTVPINYSVQTKLEWLAGYMDADGCVNINSTKTATSIQVVSTNYDFLKDVQMMMTTLGMSAPIKVVAKAQERMLPDGNGGSKAYWCNEAYIMHISTSQVFHLVSLGFSPKRLKLISKEINGNPCLVRVESITDENRISDTFCFNEPRRHAGTFNGIVTGQSEMYSLLIDSLVSDEKERNSLFESVETIPAVGKKAAWAQKWLNPSKTFAERLVAWVCVEGLLFSGSFCALFWLRNRGVMPGLGLSNEFISRDEGLHQMFGETLYSKLENKLSFEEIRNIVTEAVENEKDFICDAIPCKMIGMNSEIMSQYIEFVADRIFVALGHSKFYNSVNPFDFMELISLQGKTNFFEKKVSEYQRAGVMNAEDNIFGLDADF